MVEATRLVLQPLDSSFRIRCFPNSFGTIGTGRLQEISDSTGDQSLGMVKMLRLNGLQMTYDVQALITEVGRRSHVLQNEALVLAILALAKPRRLGFINQPFLEGTCCTSLWLMLFLSLAFEAELLAAESRLLARARAVSEDVADNDAAIDEVPRMLFGEVATQIVCWGELQMQQSDSLPNKHHKSIPIFTNPYSYWYKSTQIQIPETITILNFKFVFKKFASWTQVTRKYWALSLVIDIHLVDDPSFHQIEMNLQGPEPGRIRTSCVWINISYEFS